MKELLKFLGLVLYLAPSAVSGGALLPWETIVITRVADMPETCGSLIQVDPYVSGTNLSRPFKIN